MRRKPKALDPADRLARLLREAFIAAYIRVNPHHDSPAWDDVQPVAKGGWLAIAEELLARGVRLPDAPVAPPRAAPQPKVGKGDEPTLFD